MVFQITLAEIVIEIHSVFKFVYHYCREYRSTEKNVDFVIKTSLEEIDNELINNPKSFNNSNSEQLYSYGFTEFLIIFRKIANKMPMYSSFFFHGTVISDGNDGFILSAPSGTGKTTRAQLLTKMVSGPFIVNGDKPLIQIKNNKAIVYGTPWRGKEYIGKNIFVPLSSIFLLQRSETTKIEEISFSVALPELINQVYFPETGDMVKASIQLLTQLENSVRVYRYCSTSNALDVIDVYNLAKRL